MTKRYVLILIVGMSLSSGCRRDVGDVRKFVVEAINSHRAHSLVLEDVQAIDLDAGHPID